MCMKYVYKNHKFIRLILLIYSVLFPFFSEQIFIFESTYKLLCILCILNLILLIFALIYIIFCFKNKYYFDIFITTIAQIHLAWYSLSTLFALGLLLGGQI